MTAGDGLLGSVLPLPTSRCPPPAAHLPLPTYLVRLLSLALPQPPHQACREKRKKLLDAPSRAPLHAPPQAAALGALQTAEDTGDCPVFKGQCATASGSSTGTWRRGPVTLRPALGPLALPSCLNPNTPQMEPELQCDKPTPFPQLALVRAESCGF